MPYKRNKKNKIEWVAEIMRNGKRHYKIFPTKKEALEWEAQTRAKSDEELMTHSDSLTLLDWATKYMEYAQTRFVYKTFLEKKACFKRFFQTVDPQILVDELHPRDVLWHIQKRVKEKSGYAANKERKNLVAAWNWGIKYLGLPTANPCLVDRFAEQRHTRYVPSEGDFWKIFDLAEGQNKVMLLAYLHLAARRSELFSLRWDDVDFNNQRVRLWTRKRQGGNLEYDWLPMTDELFQALLEHKKNAHHEWVFVDQDTYKPFTCRRQFMKGLCKRAKIRPFGFHAIRHLTASILAHEDVPMVMIQQILRHKNLSTTEKYIRGLAPVKPALEILSGRGSRRNFTTKFTTTGKNRPKLRVVK